MCQIAAQKIGCDATRAAFASEMQQDLPDHVGQQRRRHKPAVRGHGSLEGKGESLTCPQECLVLQGSCALENPGIFRSSPNILCGFVLER